MTHPSTAHGILDTEPVVVFLTGLAGIVNVAIIAADALDWVALTNEQTAALAAFVTGATALVAAVLRSKVWAPATVAHLHSSGPVV